MAQETPEQKMERLEQENKTLREENAKLKKPTGGGQGSTKSPSMGKPARQ